MKNKEKLISELLVTPVNLAPISVENEALKTPDLNFKGKIHQGVAVMLDNLPRSFFDDKYQVMAAGHSTKGGDWQIGYQQQVQMIEKLIENKKIVLDVGCGPQIPYRKSAQNTLIGVEYSFHSIAANTMVNLPVCASAAALPLRDQSIDVILAVYSVHHMIGKSRKETQNNVMKVLQEFFRVVRPGGSILVIEMAPIEPFGFFQDLFWDLSKKVLGSSLDQFFWTPKRLKKACHNLKGWKDPRIISFASSWWVCFPPIFSLPWLKIPRFLYPLSPIGYLWKF
jgi:ubiquinone/menaquinone biosynthesis C-methylase UbiE